MYRAKPGVEMPGPFPEGRLYDGYQPMWGTRHYRAANDRLTTEN
jgi:hypothetical protein